MYKSYLLTLESWKKRKRKKEKKEANATRTSINSCVRVVMNVTNKITQIFHGCFYLIIFLAETERGVCCIGKRCGIKSEGV